MMMRCNNYHKSSFEILFLRAQISGYTSTGESRSEAEDITSPKAYGNSMNPTLTPVKDEASDHT